MHQTGNQGPVSFSRTRGRWGGGVPSQYTMPAGDLNAPLLQSHNGESKRGSKTRPRWASTYLNSSTLVQEFYVRLMPRTFLRSLRGICELAPSLLGSDNRLLAWLLIRHRRSRLHTGTPGALQGGIQMAHAGFDTAQLRRNSSAGACMRMHTHRPAAGWTSAACSVAYPAAPCLVRRRLDVAPFVSPPFLFLVFNSSRSAPPCSYASAMTTSTSSLRSS